MKTTTSTTLARVGLGASLTVFGLGILQSPGQVRRPTLLPPGAVSGSFSNRVAPVVNRYCVSCHSGKDAIAGLDLTKYGAGNFAANGAIWDKVVKRIVSGEMPPSGSPRPTAAIKTQTVAYLREAIKNQCRVADPGRVTIRRLNREEYNNTIRDLTGLDLRPADDFPSDDVGNGFDNMGDVLSISPLLMEKYLAAAEMIAQKAIVLGGVRTRRFDTADFSNATSTSPTEDGGRAFLSNAESRKEVDFGSGGSFRLRVRAFGDQAGPEPTKMAILLDSQPLQAFTVEARRASPKFFETVARVPAGKHAVGVMFLNDFYDARQPVGRQDRNLFTSYVEVTGPLDADAPMPDSHRRIIPRTPSRDAAQQEGTQDLANFATKAFRRPVTAEETERLGRILAVGMKSGGTFEEGMRLGVATILSSPHFLFRVELDPKGTTRELNDYEIASRLSYFLWSTMPDDELFAAAKSGKLHQPAVLAAQAKRMLLDPKAEALGNNFAGQWLQLRKLSIVAPDPDRFPGIDEALKRDMATETKMFFGDVVRNNRSILDFIDGKFTYVNGRLAKHYGMSGITGDDFQRIPVTGDRGGVITQASVLTVTSNPTRTSPTKRGKWVLENILGTPPPPPPPGVGDIKDEKHRINAATLRELMAEHRKNPVCASCHTKMDPIGFGLDNFDAVGRLRTKDGVFDIDTSGVLPDGRSFRGPSQLKKILLSNKDQFTHALSEKLMTFALGRGIEPTDNCNLDAIVARAKSQEYRFSSIVTGVVTSEAFRKRRGDPKAK